MTTPTAPHNPLTWILPLSAGLAAFLLWLPYGKPAATTAADWMTMLPTTNALFNALSACCLIGGLLNIRRGNRAVHIRFMLAAVICSTFFLVGYIVHHHFHGDTPFPGQGFIRPIYFTILISHIVLSVIALPLVLTTLYYAATAQYQTTQDCPLTFPFAVRFGHGVAVFLFSASLHLRPTC